MHIPARISEGRIPLLPGERDDDGEIDPCDPGPACVLDGERESVLRMRVDHPNRFEECFQPSIAPTVGVVFQTDIQIQPEQGEACNRVLLLRFDHFGLHPIGGSALDAMVIAERCESGAFGVEWGRFPNLIPFSTDVPATGCSRRYFTTTVLGSPVYECETIVDDVPEICSYKMPRRLAIEEDAESFCGGIPAAEDIRGVQPSMLTDEELEDEPRAAWRTVEMRVSLDNLPDWDDQDGLGQIDKYRFTVAFRLIEETVFANDDVLACGTSSICRKAQGLVAGFACPAYSEIDQVVLELASFDGSEYLDCDFGPGSCQSGCSLPSVKSGCRMTSDGNLMSSPSEYEPSDGSTAVEWVGDPAVEDIESRRGPEQSMRVEYVGQKIEDHIIKIGNDCCFGTWVPYQRLMREESFVPASCPGDFDGNGGVDGADFGLLLAAWGPCAECLEDLDCDGVVTGADLGQLLSFWGGCS
ncbi:MAG: hypothetical protein GY895_12435 [Phycisphaera sp.]|nr:hypothetical protein [Phycisphaera sp.]